MIFQCSLVETRQLVCCATTIKMKQSTSLTGGSRHSAFTSSLARCHRTQFKPRTSPHGLPSQAEAAAHCLTFPHGPSVEFGGRQVSSEELIQLLEPYVSQERMAKIDNVVRHRTYSITPVLEHTYDMGNLAAVCRTSDAFGMGAVQYVKRTDEKYKVSTRSSAGADKWLDVKVWNSTAECVHAIKEAGMQLVVTHLSKSSVTVQEVDFTRPTAVVFGNERLGASDEIVAAADACCIIPMAGFVESFNISVAAALVMYEAQQQRLRKLGSSGDLTPEQQLALKAAMMMRSVREPEMLIRELMSRPDPRHHQQAYRERVKAAAAAAAAS